MKDVDVRAFTQMPCLHHEVFQHSVCVSASGMCFGIRLMPHTHHCWHSMNWQYAVSILCSSTTVEQHSYVPGSRSGEHIVAERGGM